MFEQKANKFKRTQKRNDTGKTARLRRGSSGTSSSLGAVQAGQRALSPPDSSAVTPTITSPVIARTESRQSCESLASCKAHAVAKKGAPENEGRGEAIDVCAGDNPKQTASHEGPQQHLPTQNRAASQRRSPATIASCKVDFSWRRPPVCRKSADFVAETPLACSRNSQGSQQAKRKRLFELFQKYDKDDSGTLDAGEVCSLLSDMGHKYEEDHVRQALDLIVPAEQVDTAIHLQDFCEWWECLNWFHQLGIQEGALSMASAKYKKGEWLEDMKDLKADIKGLQVRMHGFQLDNMRRNRWYEARYSDAAEEIECPGTFRASNALMATANHFFEFVQKEMAGRPKSQGAMLISKKRSAAADLLAAANAKNRAKRTPEKYLRP